MPAPTPRQKITLPEAPAQYDVGNERETRRIIERLILPGSMDCYLFCGNGSPEGVVTSPVGGIYEQLDAAITTHSIWVKRSGTGNTGWRAWAGLRGSGTGSLAIGDNAAATAADSMAIGEGSSASAASAIAIGDGATASAADAIAVGQAASAGHADAIAIGSAAQSANPQDIVIGQDSQVSAVTGSPTTGHVAIGQNVNIDATDKTGQIAIGLNASIGPNATIRNAVVIGPNAYSSGRANVIIGELAKALDATGGRSEGRFGVAVGYLAQLSGGCVVAVGDQTYVKGDNALAVGTHADAWDNSTTAVGSGAFAGSVAANGSGYAAVAVGASATATGGLAAAFGFGANALKGGALAIGYAANANHNNAIALGREAYTGVAHSLMIGSEWGPITAIYFNGSSVPAFYIAPDGSSSSSTSDTSSFSSPKTGSYTMGASERQVWVNSSGGSYTITLPTAPADGTRVRVWRTAGSNSITVQGGGSDTVEGSTYTLSGLASENPIWATFQYLAGSTDWSWVDGY